MSSPPKCKYELVCPSDSTELRDCIYLPLSCPCIYDSDSCLKTSPEMSDCGIVHCTQVDKVMKGERV